MLRTFQPFIGEYLIDEQNKSFQAISWAIRSTINFTTKCAPGQLTFGRDIVVQAKVLIDWKKIMKNKDAVTTKGLTRENNKIIDHIYHDRDHVMITLDRMEQNQKINAPYTGPN